MTQPLDRYTQVDGLRTRYWEMGEGPPLVLVHGLGASVEIWERNIGALSEAHHVYAPDLLGYGRTEKPEIDYTLEAFVDFVVAFMDAMALSRADLLGHSLGGAIVLRLAIEHPERVDRLVVADGAAIGEHMSLSLRLVALPLVGELLLRPRREKTAQALRALYHDPTLVTEELIEHNYEMITMPGAQRAYLSTVRNLATPLGIRDEVRSAIKARLDEVKAPVLLLWGAEDQLVPVDDAVAARERLADAQLVVIEAAGHNVMVERPERFNEAVRSFLASP